MLVPASDPSITPRRGQSRVELEMGNPPVAQDDQARPLAGDREHPLERLRHACLGRDLGRQRGVGVEIELADAAVAPDLLGLSGQLGAADALRRGDAPGA